MKKVSIRMVLATVLYGAFMAVCFSLRHGFPVGLVPAMIATVIYITAMSVFLRRRKA